MPDENTVVSQALNGKTAHQRNKSTPAVSALLQNAAVRPNNVQPKRTAFADVSNISSRPVHITSQKEDHPKSQIELASHTHGAAPLSHPSDPVQRTAVPLSRLAQRPANGIAKSSSAVTSTQPVLTSTTSRPVPAAAKVHSKRSMVLATREYNAADALSSSSSTTITSNEKADLAHFQGHAIPTASAPIDMPVRLSAGSIVPSQPAMFRELDDNQPYHVAINTQTEQQLLLALEQQAQAMEAERGASLATSHETARGSLGYYEAEEDASYSEDGIADGHDFKTKAESDAASVVALPTYTTKIRQEIELARHIVEDSRTAEDIEDETWDTSMVAEYSEEIFSYMKELEVRMTPNAHYMDHQSECQWSMRAVLMDWLIQVHQRFGLLPETLFLAVNYIDRFLSLKVVSLPKLQLVGATAIFLASKFEEVNCPSIAEIVYMVDNGYTADEILKAERFMLSMLTFDLGWPGPMSFLRRISKADDYDLETRTLAKYFLEVTIMDERFVACPPSFTAAGAHCLARLMLRKGDWSQAHVYYSDYTYAQLFQQIRTILECCGEAEDHHGVVFEKYKDKRFKRASMFVKSEIHNGFQLPPLSSPNSTDSSA